MKIKMKRGAPRELRNQPKVRADLMRRAKNVAAAAGGEEMGFKITDLVLEENRAAVSVIAFGKARAFNNKYHSLLKGLSAGKGW